MPTARHRSMSPGRALAVSATMGRRRTVVALERTNGPGRLVPVHLRHLAVHEHEVVRQASHRVHRLRTVADHVRPVAQALERLDGHGLIQQVVFRNEDAPVPTRGFLRRRGLGPETSVRSGDSARRPTADATVRGRRDWRTGFGRIPDSPPRSTDGTQEDVRGHDERHAGQQRLARDLVATDGDRWFRSASSTMRSNGARPDGSGTVTTSGETPPPSPRCRGPRGVRRADRRHRPARRTGAREGRRVGRFPRPFGDAERQRHGEPERRSGSRRRFRRRLSPFINSTRRLEMARPRPVPP